MNFLTKNGTIRLGTKFMADGTLTGSRLPCDPLHDTLMSEHHKPKTNDPAVPCPFTHRKRYWHQKFADAFRGLRQSVYQQSSYHAHFAAAVAVIGSAWYLGNFDTVRWSILIFCITTVIASEMFNTAIETLARSITSSYDPLIGRALDIASGAVLVLSFGSAIVGIILFTEALLRL